MYYPLTSSISNGLVALYGSDERIINNNNNNVTPKNAWGIDLGSTDNNCDSLVNSEWTLVTTKNQRNQRKLTSEEDVWELKFDLDEMQELFTMSTCPYVKGLLLPLADELQNRMKNMRCDLTEKLGVVKKWSDVVAGRSTCRKEGSNRNLESNITSHTTEEPWITENRGHKKTSICKSCNVSPNPGNKKLV